ncbi:hypothetical protein MWU52_04065 [Jannaschia sp. S6380]|nr:hypothetical protein [Jannaschia sp. S6380]MCK0166722.1 hypothetical protein [Jannaschia sp. S6380]
MPGGNEIEAAYGVNPIAVGQLVDANLFVRFPGRRGAFVGNCRVTTPW